MENSHLQFTVVLPRDLVEGIEELGGEMTRYSGKTYTTEEVIAVLVVQGFRVVTTEEVLQ